MKKIYLCAISNISSGSCNENCKFCTQSSRYRADIHRYREKSIDTILEEAKVAILKNRAVGFCLVTSGVGLNDKKLEFVCKSAKIIRNELGDEFNLIGCNGLATKEQLKELKKFGVNAYNHNLETSESFYPKVCNTHTWKERFKTCENVKEVGLKLVSGGIFGMGESKEDRISLVKSLKSLKPSNTPLNFFMSDIALPLKSNQLSVDEALDIISYARKNLESKKLMLAAGRETLFKDRQVEIFERGVNSIVIGDYLTKSGDKPHKDLEMLKSLNLEVAEFCDE